MKQVGMFFFFKMAVKVSKTQGNKVEIKKDHIYKVINYQNFLKKTNKSLDWHVYGREWSHHLVVAKTITLHDVKAVISS